MAHDFFVYDFGSDEEKAQQARHKVASWAQGFRLGKKLLLKFDRSDSDEAAEDSEKPAKAAAPKKKATNGDATVSAIVRLDFSSHEKLSHQRWLERIPTEEPFKSAKGKVVRSGDAAHRETSDRFDALS
jgi:hypothetical protein